MGTQNLSAKLDQWLKALWLILLIGLSHFSAYKIAAVGDLNFAIATMLTPWGLIQNLIFGQNPELHFAYFEPTQNRLDLFSSPAVLTCYLVFAFCSALILRRLRK